MLAMAEEEAREMEEGEVGSGVESDSTVRSLDED
jgi:hypothetical protein